MSHLSLLFPPAMQSLVNQSGFGRETGRNAQPASDAIGNAYTEPASKAEGYELPLGIVSLDHWLDLNA